MEVSLDAGGCCSAANWSETIQKVLVQGRNWDHAAKWLRSYDLVVEPVTIEDGEWAARRWRRGEGLSLGDRLCLALAARLGAEVLTADRAWGTEPPVKQIR